jgi:methionyl-tRNA formyltransferase
MTSTLNFDNSRKCLVFTSKWVGLKCVEYLINNFINDEYLFVVMEPDREMIVDILSKSGKKYLILDSSTIDYINSAYNDAHFDFLLNLWGGHIFKKPTLLKAKKSLNIHPAFLPYCRGRDPVVWAIRNSDPAGVTLHEISEDVDEGNIIYREEIAYTFPIRGEDLYNKVVDRSWRIFCERWSGLRNFEWETTSQLEASNNDVGKTHKRQDLISDRVIDAEKEPEAFETIQRIMAHDFGDYSAQIKIGEKIYSVNCTIKSI